MSQEQQPYPASFAPELDRLFAALRDAESLLGTGRAYGLTVALSPALAALIAMRHGDEAAPILNNTQRVDPAAPFRQVAT